MIFDLSIFNLHKLRSQFQFLVRSMSIILYCISIRLLSICNLCRTRIRNWYPHISHAHIRNCKISFINCILLNGILFLNGIFLFLGLIFINFWLLQRLVFLYLSLRIRCISNLIRSSSTLILASTLLLLRLSVWFQLYSWFSLFTLRHRL